MIDLENITESWIKNFVGDIIFNRGKEYYDIGMVTDVDIDPETSDIEASVRGNSYYEYDVDLTRIQEGFDAHCSCPYDGYPCKHIVAVLIYLINNKSKLRKCLKNKKSEEAKIRKKLDTYSKEDLINIIISNFNRISEFKKNILVELSFDDQKTIKEFYKLIDLTYVDLTTDDYSTAKIARQMSKLIRQIDSFSPQFKYSIFLRICEKTLHELNEYGMDDDHFERLAIDVLEKLTLLVNTKKSLFDKRGELYNCLERFYQWDNCGITDSVAEAMESIKQNNFKL